MDWIKVAPGAPYFQTESGTDWTPVGHNDAVDWITLQGCFRRRDLPAVDAYLAMLARSGVTVIRVMLEYSQRNHRSLERPAGSFVPAMVRYWDDLIALCEKHGIRLLLTPFDTFWLWIRWKRHPYNQANGGPLKSVKRMLIDPEARKAIKRRMEFATTRWGGSGAIFAWDLWNEIHPAMAENKPEALFEFIDDVSTHVRQVEMRAYGRTHPQTVSIFGPLGLQYPLAYNTVLTHPCLDFASTHFYEEGTIDDPRNTVDAAISTGNIMREVLTQTPPDRPFFDSESGPIHSFKDKKKTLPEAFDDEYFRHMQWAHFASGGAGGGMRWPNRRPHVLTAGMHRAQQALSAFLPNITWQTFHRRNWNQEVSGNDCKAVAAFACGDRHQALVWLLRRDRRAGAISVDLTLPAMEPGLYQATLWDTVAGCAREIRNVSVQDRPELLRLPVAGDFAIALTPR